MGQSLQAAINAQDTAALGQFASADAALKRQNIQYADSFSRQFQAQENMQRGVEIQRRMQLEQAWGRAMQLGIQNLYSKEAQEMNFALAAGQTAATLAGVKDKGTGIGTGDSTPSGSTPRGITPESAFKRARLESGFGKPKPQHPPTSPRKYPPLRTRR